MASRNSSTKLPPRKRLTRAQSQEETRKRLLDAASHLFRRIGYHATTLEQVAKSAGYTKGAVYSAFASKADLFLELIAERIRLRAEHMLAADVPAATSPADYLRAIAEVTARSAIGDADYWASVIEFKAFVARDATLRKRYAAHHAASLEAITAAIERWAELAGREMTLPTRSIAAISSALTNGLILETMVSPGSLSPDDTMEAWLALLEGLSKPARQRA